MGSDSILSRALCKKRESIMFDRLFLNAARSLLSLHFRALNSCLSAHHSANFRLNVGIGDAVLCVNQIDHFFHVVRRAFWCVNLFRRIFHSFESFLNKFFALSKSKILNDYISKEKWTTFSKISIHSIGKGFEL
mgnify:CR=1 FL=1